MKNLALLFLIFLFMPFVGVSQEENDSTIINDSTIVVEPTKKAMYPGGEDEFINYLIQNITYPWEARSNGNQGKIYFEFIVWMDGTITDIKPLNKIGGGCEEEVIRVLKLMPNWIPAEHNGKKVNSIVKFPFVFKLAE